jgi:sulfotransferase family protein
MIKCNLIVPGFGKSGTSSLHEYLALHPEICMSDPKEPNFHVGANWQRGEDWYNSLFHDAGRARRWYGESSTAYSVWEPAMERIKKCLHQPRFIVMLRHPVERLISHYKSFWARNVESRPLLRAVQEEEEKGFHPDSPVPGVIYTPYRRLSHYSYFCPVMEQIFGRENILYLNSGELSKDPQRALNKCFRFLCLREHVIDREIRENKSEGKLIQRTFGLKTLLKPFPRSFLDRIDPGSRMRFWVRRTLGQKKRRPPEISTSDKEKLAQMLKRDISFYESVFQQPLDYHLPARR